MTNSLGLFQSKNKFIEHLTESAILSDPSERLEYIVIISTNSSVEMISLVAGNIQVK